MTEFNWNPTTLTVPESIAKDTPNRHFSTILINVRKGQDTVYLRMENKQGEAQDTIVNAKELLDALGKVIVDE